MNKFKIIITGGGSGGHTMPALAIIEELIDYCNDNSINLDLLYLGSKNSIEERMSKNKNIPFKHFSTGKFRRYFSLKNFTDLFKIFWGIIQNILIIGKFKPSILISTGGFVSIPPVIASYFRRVPILIHEQTIEVGLANKIASKFAGKICTTFEESNKYFPNDKTILTGLPIRKAIFSGSKESAIRKFNFDLSQPVLYFTGGGLGCHILNKTTLIILSKLLQNYNIIFQSGNSDQNNDYEELLKFKKSLPLDLYKKFVLYDFITNDIGDILLITTLAISRSGAGTVNEFFALNIPAIFIPLPFATKNEQFENAKFLENKGGAVIINEADLTEDLLYKTIKKLTTPKKISTMKQSLMKKEITNPKQKILSIILKLTR